MKIKKALKYFAIILLVIVVVVLSIAPNMIASYVNDNGKELIGRKVQVEDIDLNYFTLSASVEGLIIYESDEQTVFVSFNQFMIDLNLWKLPSSEIYIEEALLDAPYVNIEKNDSLFNFDDIIAHFNDTVQVEDEAVVADSTEEVVKYTLNNFRLSHGKAVFHDLELDNEIKTENLNLEIPAISWNNQSMSSGLKFNFENGGDFETKYDINLDSSTYHIDFVLHRFDLKTIAAYIKEQVLIEDLSGNTDIALSINGNMDKPEEVVISGSSLLRNIDVTGPEGNVFRWDSVMVDLELFDFSSQVLNISRIELVNPVLEVLLDTSGNSLERLIANIEEDSLTSDSLSADTNLVAEDTSTWNYYIDTIKMVQGGLVYYDRSVELPLDYSVQRMNLLMSPISSDSGLTSINFSCLMGERGEFSLNGAIDTYSGENMELKMELNNLVIKDFTPYSNYYIGNDIERGLFNFESSIHVASGHIESDHHILVDKPDLAKRNNSNAQYKLPVRLGLELLKDVNDNIDLNVKMVGDMDDPDYNTKELIWKTLSNIVIRAAASPVKLLSDVAGADTMSLDEVQFDLTSVEIGAKQRRKLDLVEKVLEKKDRLNVIFTYYPSATNTIETLAENQCLLDYYLKEVIGDSLHVMSSKDSLNMEKQRASEEFLLHLKNLSKQESEDRKKMSVQLLGVDRFKAITDSINEMRVDLIKRYMFGKELIDEQRFSFQEAEEGSDKSREANIAIQFGLID